MIVENSEYDLGDLYTIDTLFLGHERHVGAHLLMSEDPVLIDPGASTGAGVIREDVESLPVSPADVEYVFLSHLHLDHAGAAGYLMDYFPNATVLAHRNSLNFLSKPEDARKLVDSAHRAVGDLAEEYGDMKVIPENRLRGIEGGDTLDLGDRRVKFLEASGHAPHQVCLYEDKNEIIYVADEVGIRINGTVNPATPPPNFDLERTLESLEVFREHGPENLVFPHFGVYPEVDSCLDEYRETLVDWVETVESALDRLKDTRKVVDWMIDARTHHDDRWGDGSIDAIVKTDTLGVLRYLEDSG